MTITAGDMVAFTTRGRFISESAPDAPALSVERLTETSLRATIDGDTGATNYLLIAAGSDDSWTDAGSRAGDGTIDVADLTAGQVYLLICYSGKGGYKSSSSDIVVLTLTADDDDTPTGPLSLPLFYLKETLAASETFQGWIGATGTTEEKIATAKTRIYEFCVERADWTRPYAFITDGDSWRAIKDGEGTHSWFGFEGALAMGFESDITEGEDVDLEARRLRNIVGAIIDEMNLLAGRGGYLAIDQIDKEEGPVESAIDATETENAEHFFQMTFMVGWK